MQKQNDERAQGEPYEDKLKFDSVRLLLKDTTGVDQMQRILSKLDTNFDARISFEEF